MNTPANEPPPTLGTGARCFECGADLVPGARFCWLCGVKQPLVAEVISPPIGENPFRQQNPWLVHGACWGVAIALALVGCGVYATDPWYCLAYAVAVVPAFLIALGGATMGRATGSPWHPVLKVGIFVAVLGVSVPLGLAVMIYGLIVTFLQQCFPAS